MAIKPVSLTHAWASPNGNHGRVTQTGPTTRIYSNGHHALPRVSWDKDTVVKRATPPPLPGMSGELYVPTDHEVVRTILEKHAKEERQWTPAMLRTFDRLSAMCCSMLLTDRARGRVWLDKFVEKHGRKVCDAMLAHIRERDAREWFGKKGGKQ